MRYLLLLLVFFCSAHSRDASSETLSSEPLDRVVLSSEHIMVVRVVSARLFEKDKNNQCRYGVEVNVLDDLKGGEIRSFRMSSMPLVGARYVVFARVGGHCDDGTLWLEHPAMTVMKVVAPWGLEYGDSQSWVSFETHDVFFPDELDVIGSEGSSCIAGLRAPICLAPPPLVNFRQLVDYVKRVGKSM